MVVGKRSTFERVAKDYYPTIDKRAVEALMPVLEKRDAHNFVTAGDGSYYRVDYIEPCAGTGELINQIRFYGHNCVAATDIMYYSEETGNKDVFSYTSQDLNDADCFITNPPWSRHILHPLIEHLSALLPTWLLFDADWAHTKQSAPYMKLCTDIVSVGRLIWIPGTTMTGKDNCAWYRFDKNNTKETIFHGRT